MAAFQKFNDFSEELLRGTHDFAGDTFKLMLTTNTPGPADAVKADITEIAAGNGYPAGGQVLAVTLTRVSGSGVSKVTVADEVFTAAGGTMATFRYGVIYNDTAGSKNLVGWFDHSTGVSLADGETFTADFDATNGLFTLA
jgi:hypothetical protein